MIEHLTAEEFKRLAAKKAPSKYRNEKVKTSDGKTIDSKKEELIGRQLAALAKAGEITDLRTQVPFNLIVNGIRVCKYIADFVYQRNGERVVVDAKGFRTREYKLKKRLMLACHGITITEY